MALTRCPECSGQVSVEAARCPYCGHPMAQTRSQTDKDWRERFRRIHTEEGLVHAIQYLRDAGVEPSEIRQFLEQEKAEGRIPKLPDSPT
jgi:hypothetical protein